MIGVQQFQHPFLLQGGIQIGIQPGERDNSVLAVHERDQPVQAQCWRVPACGLPIREQGETASDREPWARGRWFGADR